MVKVPCLPIPWGGDTSNLIFLCFWPQNRAHFSELIFVAVILCGSVFETDLTMPRIGLST